MSVKKNIIASFKERMAEKGKVITLPKESPLRDIFGIQYQEKVELINEKEE